MPLPTNESLVMLALRVLANLAFDRTLSCFICKGGLTFFAEIPPDFSQKEDWFAHLVKILNSENQNCISQALSCIQNLLTDGIYSFVECIF